MGFLGLIGQIAGSGLPLHQQLGMTEQQRIAQQFGLLGASPLNQQFGPGPNPFASLLAIKPSPPSFEDWICTPNTETYQEYMERRVPD